MLLLNSFQIKTGVFQYAKLLFVKTGCVFRFLNVICWDRHSYKSSKLFGVTGAFGYYVKVYRGLKLLPVRVSVQRLQRIFRITLWSLIGKSVTKKDIHETLRFDIGGIGQFLGRV